MDFGTAWEQFRQRLLHFLLNAGADLLGLPAFVLGAVVGDDQFELYISRQSPARRHPTRRVRLGDWIICFQSAFQNATRHLMSQPIQVALQQNCRRGLVDFFLPLFATHLALDQEAVRLN